MSGAGKTKSTNNTPLVVSVNVDVESLDADRAGEAGLFGRFSYGRYGAREGIWRLLEVFRIEGVNVTFFVAPEDAARHPRLIEAIVEGGHELSVYGQAMDAGAPVAAGRIKAEREQFAKDVGVEPQGWRSVDGLLTRDTLRHLASAGYVYDSSAMDDDWPYLMQDGKLRLMELPIMEYLRDATFYAGHHTHRRVRKVWFEELAATYAEGGYVPLVLHSRGDHGSGRADRARIVSDFLNHAARLPGVSIMRCDQLAQSHAAAKAEGFLAEIPKPRAEPQRYSKLPI